VSGVLATFFCSGLDRGFDGRIDNNCSNTAATSRLLCLFCNFAREREIVSCTRLNTFLSPVQDLKGRCDSGSGCGGVENNWPKGFAPSLSLGNIERWLERDLDGEEVNL
jgi:hypothetical protein